MKICQGIGTKDFAIKNHGLHRQMDKEIPQYIIPLASFEGLIQTPNNP